MRAHAGSGSESYAESISISQERFESLVQAVAKSRFIEVTVSGFTIVVPKKSRSGRSHYELRAVYDPESDSWTGYDAYHGGTLPSLVYDIARAMKHSAG